MGYHSPPDSSKSSIFSSQFAQNDSLASKPLSKFKSIESLLTLKSTCFQIQKWQNHSRVQISVNAAKFLSRFSMFYNIISFVTKSVKVQVMRCTFFRKVKTI